MTWDTSFAFSTSLEGENLCFRSSASNRGAQHAISGGAAKTRVDPKRSFLFDGLSTRLEIIGVEISAQQRFQVRNFEFLDQIPVLHDNRRNIR